MRSIASSSLAPGPYPWLKPIAPKPTAETSTVPIFLVLTSNSSRSARERLRPDVFLLRRPHPLSAMHSSHRPETAARVDGVGERALYSLQPRTSQGVENAVSGDPGESIGVRSDAPGLCPIERIDCRNVVGRQFEIEQPEVLLHPLVMRGFRE